MKKKVLQSYLILQRNLCLVRIPQNSVFVCKDLQYLGGVVYYVNVVGYKSSLWSV